MTKIFINFHFCLLQVNKKLYFGTIDLYLKPSLGSLIITWNTNFGFSTILYDSKFVDLVLTAVFKKDELIGTQKLDNNKMRFVKGIFDLFFTLSSH